MRQVRLHCMFSSFILVISNQVINTSDYLTTGRPGISVRTGKPVDKEYIVLQNFRTHHTLSIENRWNDPNWFIVCL